MTDATNYAALLTQRETAGARYALAVAELHAAWTDLAGIDAALTSSRVSTSAAQIRTFGSNPDDFKLLLEHPVYGPKLSGSGSWSDEAATRRNALVSGFPSI
jgi:hypothetical protein